MTTRNRILVVGATGAQGGSVARALLSRDRFDVRALTRKPDSPAAQALRDLGAEIVQGDLDDIESLSAALEGCYGVFGVTNFWEHFDKEKEQGRHLVEAVAAANVKHFVFSTLPPIANATNGALRSPHFDLKAEHEDYARSLGIPATFVHVPFYFENFLYFFPPRPADDGAYAQDVADPPTQIHRPGLQERAQLARAAWQGLADANPVSGGLRFELPEGSYGGASRPRRDRVRSGAKGQGRRGRPANVRHQGKSR